MSAVLLMGLRGCGKSTVGAAVARELGRSFVDLDVATLALLGAATVAEAWERFGEQAFRDAELRALESVLETEPDAIVALGGGTPMVDGFEAITEGTRRVYLSASPAELRGRIGGDDPNRPSLTGGAVRDEIEEVHAQRHGEYKRLAHDVIDAGGSVGACVERLCALLRDD